MQNTLGKLNEVKAFLTSLLDSANDEAIDLIINYGEDIEETLQEAINAISFSLSGIAQNKAMPRIPPLHLKELTVAQIADIIRKDWQKVNFAAKPYLSAMESMQSVKSSVGYDTGKTVVLYFLSNAASWRGETAKAVKLELKNRTK